MAMTDDFTVTQRNIDVQQTRLGPIVAVVGMDFSDDPEYYVPRKTLGKYAFRRLTNGMGDKIRGHFPETDGTAVIHVGNNFGKHYWVSHDDTTVPIDVLEWLRDNGYSFVTNVDGGWDSWDGRPEFSTSYIDFTEATVMDLDEEIATRRD